MNIYNTYNFVIWNNGDKPEKSAKRLPTVEIVSVSNDSLSNDSVSNDSVSNSKIKNESVTYITPTIYRESNNKRQESSDKISQRYLVGQRGLNPYISQTSYVSDIETQESFLIPKSSNKHPKNRVDFT